MKQTWNYLVEKLKEIEFAASNYCPACAGWNVDPGRGCTPKAHTKTCWLKQLISTSTDNTQQKIGRRVVCAAMRNKHGVIVCSARHHDKLMNIQMQFSHENWEGAEQGFIDQKGNFLTRKEALEIAIQEGQILRRVGGDDKALYSENIY